MDEPGCICLGTIQDMHCPLHGDVTSLGPIDPELEAALESTKEQVVSEPLPGAKPLPCRAHGSPFAEMAIREDGTNWKVYEDGCREPL